MPKSDVSTPDRASPKYPIESVDNALHLLLMFRERPLLRVSEVARELEIAPSTAHRLLAMLLHHGFVRHDPATRGYVAGHALLDVGLAVVHDIDIRQKARVHLERLVAQLNETAHLTILDGGDVLFLDAVESTQALRAADRTGTRLPAHCTASGKALLAELPAEELARALGPGRLARLSPNSIVRRSDLEQELSEIRSTGYAVNRGESESELLAVASAIPTGPGPAHASVVVSAPRFRTSDAWISQAADLLQQCVRAIANERSY